MTGEQAEVLAVLVVVVRVEADKVDISTPTGNTSRGTSKSCILGRCSQYFVAWGNVNNTELHNRFQGSPGILD